MLIVSRALQGIGAAALMPSALALLRNLFHDEKERRTAITVWSIGVASGAGIGPVISGLLLNNFWWGSIFLINAPIIAVLLLITPALIPNFRTDRSEISGFDPFSALLSLASVLLVIWGITEASVNGLNTAPIAAMVGGVLLGALFLWRQQRLEDPMIDPALFKIRGFSPVLTLSLTGFFCIIGFGVFTTQYLMEVKGMRPLTAALWTMASPAIAGGTVPFAADLVNKIRPALVIAAGFALATVGYVVMTQVHVSSAVPLVIAGAVGIGVGTATIFALLTDMVVAVAPEEKVATVSALSKTTQELGGAMGIAIFGTVGSTVYRHYFAAHAPAGLPPGTLAASKQTMGAATAIAQQLPPAQSHTLLEVARTAFTNSLNVTAIVGIVVAGVSVWVALSGLGHVRYNQEKAAETEAEPIADGQALVASE
jgi:DHA2 family multidrug resistance protein-like MFS transporter